MTNDFASIRERLLTIIEKEGMIAREKLLPEATMESLNMASYDMVMVLMGIEEEFGIYLSVDAELTEIETLNGLLDHLAARIAASQSDAKSAVDAPSSVLRAK